MNITNSAAEEYLRLARKDEYEKEEARKKYEEDMLRDHLAARESDIQLSEFPLKKLNYQTSLAKAVITECVTRLYMNSLIIDKADQYADTLKPVARREIVSLMESDTCIEDLKNRFQNASPYVKEVFSLAETIIANKTDDDVKAFDNKIILDSKDIALIKNFEKENSSDVYSGAIQDRIIDVYKAEEELSKQQKEKVQAVVDSLSNIEGETVTEAIEKGINIFDKTPRTIFNAIFVNKSRAILNECGAGADINNYSEEILCETICTYTLLECIHSLGLKTYSDEEKIRLRYEFAAK